MHLPAGNTTSEAVFSGLPEVERVRLRLTHDSCVSNSTSGLHEAGCTGAGQLGRQGPRDMGAGGEGEGRYGLARKAVNKDGLERKAVNKGSSSIGNLQSEISAMYPSRRKERKHITFTIA